MDKHEALHVLHEVLERLRREPYDTLIARISAEPVVEEKHGNSGKWYQVEVVVVWDDRPGGNVRVMGSVDDGGWRAVFPVTRSFIKASDGSFVGE